jgi:hypothetical protein
MIMSSLGLRGVCAVLVNDEETILGEVLPLSKPQGWPVKGCLALPLSNQPAIPKLTQGVR